MKNIHILPTDNPSRLRINPKGKLILSNIPIGSKGETQNIYITSDEEIKFNDYVIQVNFEKTNTQVIQCVTEFQVKIVNDKDGSFTKNKIILTTDQNLIKDGVQAIDDEFLEWFVENPSCERVEFEKEHDDTVPYLKMRYCKPYKIIIPKEESKQTVQEYEQQGLEKYSYELEPKQDFYKIGDFDKNCDDGCKYHCTKGNTQLAECLKESKQETLEEYLQVCKDCGSKEVARCKWVNVNTEEIYSADSGITLEWCFNCKTETNIIDKEDYEK